MKFLIIGADGQLGQEWVYFLSTQKVDFSAYTLSDLDITNFEKVELVIKNEIPNVLVNCAAYTAVDKAEREIKQANLVNNIAVAKISYLCKLHKIKLLHYSTDYVFAGSIHDRNTYPKGYSEEAIPNPINEYGHSKWKGEQAIIQSECNYLILRLSWLCGFYGNNFVKTMLQLAEQRDELSVVNDQFGVPTFTEQTVLESFDLINLSCYGTYHLGSTGMITWYDFAQKIFELSEVDIRVNPVSSSEFKVAAPRPLFSKLSTTKIENDLNKLCLPWEEGLKKLLNQLGKVG